jgi:PST family polysaccharide transporter
VVGTVATLISGLFSLWMLLKLLPPETLPQAVRHWLPSAA